MNKSASGRSWDILAAMVQERAKRQGPDGDLVDADRGEELEAAASYAKSLLRDKRFMAMRLKGIEKVVEDFAAWLSLDPAHPTYQRDLLGLHMRAAPRYWEIYWPEALIHEETEQRNKSKKEERPGGQKIRKTR